MGDLCQQCSVAICGDDLEDLKGRRHAWCDGCEKLVIVDPATGRRVDPGNWRVPKFSPEAPEPAPYN